MVFCLYRLCYYATGHRPLNAAAGSILRYINAGDSISIKPDLIINTVMLYYYIVYSRSVYELKCVVSINVQNNSLLRDATNSVLIGKFLI